MKASRPPASIRWNHLAGRDSDLDEVMEWTRKKLESWNLAFTNSSDAELEVCGWPIQLSHTPCRRIQFVTDRLPIDHILPGATLVVPAVQDLLNIRQSDVWNPSVVLPIPFRPLEGASGWFVVNPNDRSASIPVWRSLSAGRPVAYPPGSAYYEQVFWGGLTWSGEGAFPPSANEEDCLACLRAPTDAAVTTNLKKLIYL